MIAYKNIFLEYEPESKKKEGWTNKNMEQLLSNIQQLLGEPMTEYGRDMKNKEHFRHFV